MFIRVLAVVALLVGAAHAQVRVVGGPGVQQLAGTDALVTVILKSGGRDTNLKILEVHGEIISVQLLSGDRTAYTAAMIEEIRVQEAKLPVQRAPVTGGGALSSEDQDIVARASARAYDIFNASSQDQILKLRAAAVYAAAGQADALAYLRGLSESSDVPTAITAGLFFYTAGHMISDEALTKGIYSGNRDIKADAANLAGLSGNGDFVPDILSLLRDPTPDIYPHAARAAGRLGAEAAIPTLVQGMKALNEEKAEACVYALSVLGGDQVQTEMRKLLDEGRGLEWFRALRVLYALGDSRAKELLRTRAMREPAFAVAAAIILCRVEQDWDAMLFLRDELEKPFDYSADELIARAQISTALFEAGHVPAKTAIQGILRLSADDILGDDDRVKEATVGAAQVATCALIARSGSRSLLSLLASVIESTNHHIAVAACEAALAISDANYRPRMLNALYPQIADGEVYKGDN